MRSWQLNIRVSFNMGRLPDPRRMMVAYPAVALAAVGVSLAARVLQPAVPPPTPVSPAFLSPASPVQAPVVPALAVQGAEALSAEPTSEPLDLDDAAPAAPAETLKLPTMRMGAKRNSPVAVKLLQNILKEQGFGALLTDPHSKKEGVDGLFGPKTKKALIELQKKHHLAPTGEVDLATIKLLDKIHPIPKMPEVDTDKPRDLAQHEPLLQNPSGVKWRAHEMMPPMFPERGVSNPLWPEQGAPTFPDTQLPEPDCSLACESPDPVDPEQAVPTRLEVARPRRPRGPSGP